MAIWISDNIHFKRKMITGNKKRIFYHDEISIHQEDTTFINKYSLAKKNPKMH